MKNPVSFAAALLAILPASLASLPAASAGPADVVLAPHRAVYNLRLDVSRAGSAITDVGGRIVYELTGSSCEGYAQSMRYVTQTTNQDGDTQVTDFRNSSWEAVPAGRFRFNSSTFRNEQLIDQTRGIAERDAVSGQVNVEITRPERRKHEFAASVYFPIQHSMTLINAARESKRRVAADLFDGSEGGNKVYVTSTAIGLPLPAGAKKSLAQLKDVDKLEQVQSWPVSTSYFPKGGSRGDSLPLYEMSYRFHENGVTSSLRLDYGDYALSGELADLVYLEPGKCPRARP